MEETRGIGDLLGPLMSYGWDYILVSFLATLFGTASHYAKKCLKTEADWDTYWQNNKKNSALALVTMIGSYFGTLLADPNASLLTFAAIGYTVDSVINKAPPSTRVPKRRVGDDLPKT